jgi:uncharacterized protein DUF397
MKPNTWTKAPDCETSACVEVMWMRCDNGSCVEVAHTTDGWRVRDSKNPDGPWLSFTESEWSAFTAGVRAGHFDRPCAG